MEEAKAMSDLCDSIITQIMIRKDLTSYDEAKDILSCFGLEIDDKFVPFTARINGQEQTGLSPKQFQEKYKELLS